MSVEVSPGAAIGTIERPRLSARFGLVAGVVALALLGALLRYFVFAHQTGQTGPLAYFDGLCVWDCGWYKTIVETGYDLTPGMRLRPGAANWAFFPLYPLLAAIVHRVTTLPITMVGFFLSTTFIVVAAVASRPLFEGNTRAYWLCVVMLMIGPFSFLFNTLYTESLFIVLTVLVFASLQRERYVTAGVFGALLSATRVTGVLIVFAILVHALTEHLRAGRRLRDFPARVLTDTRLLLALFLAPVGLFAYMAYLYLLVGDALAFAHIQRAWNRELINPFETLWSSITLPWPPTPDAMVIMSWAWGSVVGLGLCLVLMIRGRWAAATFCTLCILGSLAGGITSMIRFVAGLFPLGMALCELLARSRIAVALAVVLAIVADVLLMQGWLRSSLFVM